MNSPSSDGSETIVDIFVLCKSDTENPLSTEHLEQKGYRVTLFSDSPHLLETLRFGKPNLLICDSLSLGQEAYEVCRQIKADSELWMVPVLILTSASRLGDLLCVLDCNADNFIAYPSDPHYLLSLIEGMLVTPVERQTPDQIKTQFKIQHDDHMFVVTADRRKLLEFLLSSFEIAVNKADELGRERSTNASLEESVRKIQETATEQNRIISIINATLQQKEQAITSLNAEIKNKAQQIAELDREKEFLLKERDENKETIAAAEERIRALEGEKDEASRTHALESGELSRKISDLSEELAGTSTGLRETKQALGEETARRETAESELAALRPEKEQADKSLRAMTLECGQLRNALTSEKNRALAAEQDAKSLLQAKSQSEQDLTRIIDDLKETAKQQAEDIVTLKDERVADKNRISTLEVQLANLAAGKEQSESDFRKTTEDLRHELLDLKGSLASATTALEEKTRSLAALETVSAEQKSAGEQALVQVRSLETELGVVRFALEQEKQHHAATEESLQGVIRERDSALATLQGVHEEVKSDLSAHRDDLAQAKQEAASLAEERSGLQQRLEEAGLQVRSLEEKLQLASRDQAGSDKQIRSLSDELDAVKATLETERRQRCSGEDSLRTVASAAEKTGEQLRAALAEQGRLKSELARVQEEVRRSEGQVHADHSLHEHRILEISSDLAAANIRLQYLEEQVRVLTHEKFEAEQKASSLAAEIDQARSALADEWEDHMTANERLAAAVQEKDQLRATIQPAGEPAVPGPAARAVVIRTSDLPAEVTAAPHSLVAVPAPSGVAPAHGASGVEDLFEERDAAETGEEELPSVTIVHDPDPKVTLDVYPCTPAPEIPPAEDDPADEIESDEEESGEDADESDDADAEEPDEDGDDDEDTGADPVSSARPIPPVTGLSFNRAQWFDLLKWAHHSGVLTQDQRLQIVRMGRLIQRGRRLTQKQDEQVREMLVLVQSLGYRFS